MTRTEMQQEVERLVNKEGWDRGRAEDHVGLNRRWKKEEENGYATGPRKPRGTIVARYVYRDKSGNDYTRVNRFVPKAFSQDYWDGSEWRPGGPKGDHIPYHLPEIIDRREDDIYICEGEKDADNLAALGFLTTTNQDGAGKWYEEMNPWFNDRVVYIVPDTDIAGINHAKLVGRNLRNRVKDMHRIELNADDEPKCKDVSEWIEKRQATREDWLKWVEFHSEPIKSNDVVIINPARPWKAVDETEKALSNRDHIDVLVRNFRLVQPIFRRKLIEAADGYKVESIHLSPYDADTLRYVITKHAVDYYASKAYKDGPRIIEAVPDDALMNMFLKKKHWNLNQVTGVINTPTLRPDGSLVELKGFDKATGFWLEPESNMKIELAKRPTKKDATKALELLNDLLKECAFSSELDRSVALAGILTVAARGGFPHAPAFFFTAPKAGMGKTFIVDLTSHIAFGRRAPVMPAIEDSKEMEKRLVGVLLNARPLICLDNMTFNLNEPLLCQMITSGDDINVRPLGKSDIKDCEWRGTFFGTGNNVVPSGDMVRRSLLCKLDTRTEDPERKQFNSDPIKTVMEDRAKYVSAALTITRAYLERGKGVDLPPPALAGFQEWCRFVREPLVWLGLEDPIASQAVAKESDPADNSLRALHKAWLEILKTEASFRVNDMVRESQKEQDSLLADIFFEIACTKNGRDIDTNKLGWYLRRNKEVVTMIDGKGYRIEIAKEDKNGNRWKLVEI
jgi:hypothetical protein